MSPIDQSARDSALDITQSWVVTAPAGSGKTGLLTMRVLKLLAVVEAPEEILAITFTRKAAAEMHERIVGALEEAANQLKELSEDEAHSYISTLEDAHSKAYLESAYLALRNDEKHSWGLLHNTHRLKITTIDGFCRELANQLPVLSGAGVNPMISDDPTLLYEQAVLNVIESYKGGQLSEPLNHVLTHLDNDLDRVKDLLVNLLSTREQWLPLLLEIGQHQTEAHDLLNQHLEDWGREITEQIIDCLLVYQGPLLELAHFAAQQLLKQNSTHPVTLLHDQFIFPEVNFSTLQQFYIPLCKLLLTESGSFRKTVDKRVGFPTSKDKAEKVLFKEKKDAFLALLSEIRAIEGLESLLGQLSGFPAKGYSETQWRTLEALIELLPVCTAHLKLVFRDASQTDFTEITLSALRALGSENGIPTDLSLILDYTLNHILIDEFQDTSSVQLNLLKLLTQEWQPEEFRTLFVVGDGMQSCYGFRNANVGIFLNIRDNGLENVPMSAVNLCVNFRSNQAVVNWVNTVFKKAFPVKNDINRGAVTYQESSPFDVTDKPNAHVECHGFLGDNGSQQEARFVADLITQQQAFDPNQSIAILVRGRKHLTDIIAALKRQNIPYQAVDIDPLLSKTNIQDLLTLTKLLQDPSDYLAWLAFLRAPWCGLSLSELTLVLGDHIYANDTPTTFNITAKLSDERTLSLLNSNSQQRLSRAKSLLLEAFSQRQRKPLELLVEGLWFSLGGAFTAESDTDIEDVRTYLALLGKHEQGGRVRRWQEFYSGLQRLYARPAASSSSVQPVQLMTMHKSKGLEFDTVFVCGLNRSSKADDSPLLFWHERLNLASEPQTLLSPLSPKVENDTDPVYAFLREETKQSNLLETTRLLYVASTRAKSRLYLTASLAVTPNGETKPPASNTMLARIWPAIEQDIVLHADQPSSVDLGQGLIETPTPNYVSYLTEPAMEQLDREGETHQELAPAFNNSDIQIFDEMEADHSAAIVGTVTHRILALIANDGIHNWPAERVNRESHRWQNMLATSGLDTALIPSMLKQILNGIDKTLDDPTGQWVLRNDHEFSRNEWLVHYGSQPRDAIIDRFFIENGTAWIIDYKTSTPANSQDEAGFLLQEQEKYQKQLAFYSKLVKEILPRNTPIKAGLYFPFVQSFTTVEV